MFNKQINETKCRMMSSYICDAIDLDLFMKYYADILT